MTDELRDHLLCIITDAIERDEITSLGWPTISQEPERTAQLTDTEQSIALSKQLLELHRGSASLPA
jgi:hypothetical protein